MVKKQDQLPVKGQMVLEYLGSILDKLVEIEERMHQIEQTLIHHWIHICATRKDTAYNRTVLTHIESSLQIPPLYTPLDTSLELLLLQTLPLETSLESGNLQQNIINPQPKVATIVIPKRDNTYTPTPTQPKVATITKKYQKKRERMYLPNQKSQL